MALAAQVMRWLVNGQRRVIVDSFGLGGANAQVILHDAYHYLANRCLILIGDHHGQLWAYGHDVDHGARWAAADLKSDVTNVLQQYGLSTYMPRDIQASNFGDITQGTASSSSS